MSNIVTILHNRAIQEPQKIAYLFLQDGQHETASITYAELDKKASVIAAYLQHQQLTGKQVLLLYPTGLDFISAFMGCLYAGVIAVPVNCPRITEFEQSRALIESVAKNADVSRVFTTQDYHAIIQNDFLGKKIPIIDTTGITDANVKNFVLTDINEQTIAYLQYSSGSTSTPKAAIIRHENLYHSVKYSAKAWHYTNKSVTLTWAPHSHVYGLVCGLLIPLYQGNLAILMPADAFIKRPVCWLEAITTYHVTHSGCPNFGYDLCIDKIDKTQLTGINLASWVVAINGGENVRDKTLMQFYRKFKPYGFKLNHFCSAYGMSELAGTVAVTPFKIKPSIYHNENKKNVSNGKLLPGVYAAIVDPETGTQVPHGKIGEIWLAGKSVVSGYWQQTKKDTEFNQVLPGSKRLYFRTGDLGFIKNYEICVTGRLKEILIIHGKKYYPLDLEIIANNVVNAICAAFSIEISSKEEIILLIENKENTTELDCQKNIMRTRQAILQKFGISVYDIILVREHSLPKTPSGKLQRRLCKQLFIENKLEIINKHLKKSYIHEFIFSNDIEFKKIIATILKIEINAIDFTLPLSHYRFDSITIVQLAAQLNAIYNVSFTPDQFFQYHTLSELYEAITQTRSPIMQTVTDIEKDNIPLQHKQIAIIGMSGMFPGANNIDQFWNNLLQGIDVIQEIPSARWKWQEYNNEEKTPIKWGGFIDDIAHFDASFFSMSPREAELTDPQQRLFLQVVWKAIEDAGYSITELENVLTGLYVGVFNNDYAELLQKNNITDAYVTTGITHSILANRVSYLLNLHGPSEAIDTACSSSLVAIHHAVQAIINGDCEVAIAGGVNVILTPTIYLVASKAGMLSEDGRCKTFDKNANGYVRSEGVAAILLKSLDNAIKDGDHIYGVIRGTAVNHGGHVSSLTVPNPTAQAAVITSACRHAQVDIRSINFIETHGTGTALGDPIEINGLKKAFESTLTENTCDQPYCALGAVKTHIGHLEAAAGIAGVIKVLLAMQHKMIPGNLHFNEMNPYINLQETPFYILDQTQPWKRLQDRMGMEIPRRAGVSSFGYGGTNAHLILEEFDSKTSTLEDHYPCLISLSAKTHVALQQRIQDLSAYLKKQNEKMTLSSISYTLNVGRMHYDKRCIFVVKTIDELQTTLKNVEQNIKPENVIINTDSTNKIHTQFIFTELYSILLKDCRTPELFSHAEYSSKLLALGNFYTEGHDINWDQLYYRDKKRIALPTYPFAKEYYWIPSTQRISPASILSDKKENVEIDSVQHHLIKHVSQLLKINSDKINVNISLSELGFDSIAFKELALRLENLYQIEVNPSLFFTHNTINTLTHYFSGLHVPSLKTEPSHFDHEKIEHEEIAIIGMAGYLPQSHDLQAFWQHLEKEHDLVTEIPLDRWKTKNKITNSHPKWGGLLSDFDSFDATFFNISTREANLMDPQQRLFMEIVWKTIEDAGYDPFSLANQAIGIFAGVEFNEYQTLIHSSHNLFHGHVATGNSHAMLANRISYFLNFHGPSEVIDTACSSSLVAVHRAIQAIRQQECTMAIAGGVSLMLDPDTIEITRQLGALSPDGRCKTFDKSANGYVKGEGVAAILLKSRSQAEKDGDFIYGVIKGSAVNHGGKAQSLTAPNAVAQSQVIVNAYMQAGVDLNTVTYIETHGTGTELGDPIEIEGLKQAFQTLIPDSTKKAFCGLGSVKTNIGHLEPASGIASMIKVVLSMKHATIPGTLHQVELNPYINLVDSPFYIVKQTQPWITWENDAGHPIPRRAGVSSFGFGGTNAHIVLEESHSFILSDRSPIKPYYLVTLSAKSMESLRKKWVDLRHWLQTHQDKYPLDAISFTLNAGRTVFDVRSAFVVDSISELMTTLDAMIEGLPTPYGMTNTLPVSTQQSPIYAEIYQSCMENIDQFTTLSSQTYREKLLLLADLYIKQHPLDWQRIHTQERKQRIASLPTYPFEKTRYWFDAEWQQSNTHSVTNNQSTTVTDLHQFCVMYLKKIFSDKLRIEPEQINVDATYEVYGVDSLLGLEITNQLECDFSHLPKTILYEKNQLRELAHFLQQKYPDALKKLYAHSFSVDLSQTSLPIINTLPTSSPEPIISSQTGDIAIIGLSGIYPQANDLFEFWDNLSQGKDCITEVPAERWDYHAYPVMVGEKEKFYNKGGFIPDVDKFDPLFFSIAPREAALMDPQERLFLQMAWATLEDAGYTRERLQRTVNNHVGVFAGVTYNFYPLFIADEWNKGNRLPLDIQSFSVANRVSYFLNLTGPSFVVDTACSSSLAAIHLACESLLQGECEMAFAGGVNLSLHPAKYHFLGGYGFMSDEGRCASFAAGGTGYVPSEGVGCVLLKPLALAQRDNDRIYGIIKASSMNHGGKTSGYTVPNPNAQAALIKSALQKAKIDPRSISYVEAHGTGTALGDPIEVRGLQEAFEQYTTDKQFCALGSVKSNIGHLEAAAGISQLTKVLLQMQYKKLVPSLHATHLNPYIDFSQTPFFVQHTLCDWQPVNNAPRRAGISSFGAGGTNIHVIVEEYQENQESNKIIQKPFILLLSALNSERLQEYGQHMQRFLLSQAPCYTSPLQLDEWLTQLCYTTQVARESFSARLALMGSDLQDLLAKLQLFIEQPNIEKKLLWINTSPYESLVEKWQNGTSVTWDEMYVQKKPDLISVLTYPFAKRRCWVTPSSEAPKKQEIEMTKENVSLNDWLYQVFWEKQVVDRVTVTKKDENDWLIFSDDELGYLLQDALGKSSCIYCFSGEQFQKSNSNSFYINPNDKNDYITLFSHLSDKKLKGIIYLWGIKESEQCPDLGIRLFLLFQILSTLKLQHKMDFCLVGRGSQAITEKESIHIWQYPLWSMARIFMAEQANYNILLLDLDNKKSLREESKIIACELQQFQANDNQIAYRQQNRYASRLVKYEKPNHKSTCEIPQTVLITGGLGALGAEVAENLIKQGARYLLLTGSTTLTDQKEKRENLAKLEKLGAHVKYVAVDVSNKAAMQQVITQTEQEWQLPIKGVFHLAGVTTDSITLANLSEEVLKNVLTVKIQGAMALHDIFHSVELNCFVLFSSIAALPFFGMNGLSAYAMANAFLDGLALQRSSQGLPAISINWAAWADKGMSFRYHHSAFLDAVGMSTISILQGLEILNQLLHHSFPHVIVFKVNWQTFFQANVGARRIPFFMHFTDQAQAMNENKIKLPLSLEETMTLITQILATLLELDLNEIDVKAPYQQYGLDSIIGIRFISQLGEKMGDIVSPMDLYRYPSIQQLAEYIFQCKEDAAPSTKNSSAQLDDVLLNDISHLTDEQVSQLIENELSELDELP